MTTIHSTSVLKPDLQQWVRAVILISMEIEFHLEML